MSCHIYMCSRENHKVNLNEYILIGVVRECYFIIYDRKLKSVEVWANTLHES